jgi:hypothetical protein
MSNSKISALTGATTPLAGTEVVPIVQTTTKNVSVANLTAGRAVSASNFAVTGATIPANGMYLAAANTLTFSTNTTEGIRLDSSQNFGIGLTNPSSYGKFVSSGSFANSASALGLQGASTAAIINTSSAALNEKATLNLWSNPASKATIAAYYEAFIGGGNTATGLIFGTQPNNTGVVERMRIDSAGIVTMSAYGAGAATFSAAGVISSVSDETWKIKDGVPVDPDSMLKKLEPGYWYYNDEKKKTFGTARELGFYAQNVNAAIGPEAAPTPEEGKPWGYYDRSVLAVTVMSLQKALATIESLTARITALEAN